MDNYGLPMETYKLPSSILIEGTMLAKTSPESFLMRLNLIILVVPIVLVAFVSITFRFIEDSTAEQTKKNAEAVLSNFSSYNDRPALISAVKSMEALKFFSCSKLVEQRLSKIELYNSISQDQCGFTLSGFDKIRLKGVDETAYSVLYFRSPNYLHWFLEGATYLLILSMTFAYYRFLIQREILNRSKLQRMKIERDLFLKRSKQAKHDVASPISAIQAVASVLKDVDPTIKEVLLTAADRTKQVFRDFESQSEIAAIDILSEVLQVVSEKKFEYLEDIKITIDSHSLENSKVIADSFQFKRLLSNIINNSVEAYLANQIESRKLEIQVILSTIESSTVMKVIDNGPGIKSEILDKVCEMGFSYGKESLKRNNSGLGLSHAKEQVISWGGKFQIKNNIRFGTIIEIGFLNSEFQSINEAISAPA